MNPAATRSRTPEPPYCWQSKEALRQIERTYDSESSTRLACAAYLALTRIASDKQAESFECSVKEIANYMHYRYDQTLKGIQLAEAAGVIKVERRKVAGTAENAPSIYTLLGVIEKIDKVIDSPRFAVNPESIEITEKEQRKNREVTHPQTPHDCVECVCDSHPGGNCSEGGNIPVATEAGRREAAKATVEPVAAKAAGGEAPAARACRAREKPAAGGRADDGGFAEFWAVYPRRVGKRDAKRAWAKLSPPLGKVLAALEAWRNSPAWLKDRGRYIPHPTTWLNRGGWDDELPALRQQPESFI